MKQEVDSKADYLIRELSTQAETLNSKLNEFKLVCHYCGVRMNSGVVNESCEANK